jgi:hypothetical protein
MLAGHPPFQLPNLSSSLGPRREEAVEAAAVGADRRDELADERFCASVEEGLGTSREEEEHDEQQRQPYSDS